MRVNDVTRERLRSIARRPIEEGKVLSLFIDLDPRRFAVPHARDTAFTAVLAEAQRQADAAELDQAARLALREDLERLRERLRADTLPVEGAEGLAVFASGPAGLLEVLRLPRPVPTRAVVNSLPHVGPIADLAWGEQWCVVLVSRNTARIFVGSPGALEQLHADRSRNGELEQHLRQTAARVERSQHEDGWGCLLIGGHRQLLDQFQELLGDEALSHLVGKFDADAEHMTDEEVRHRASAADAALAAENLALLLLRFEEGLEAGGAEAGLADVRRVLEEQRVEALLLAPHCVAEPEVRAAVVQDASVHRVDPAEDPRFAGHEIGAVLRF